MVEEDEEYVEIDIDSQIALNMAAQTLVTAATKAEQMNDTVALMKIAGGWMEIHEYLAGEHQPGEHKLPLGFTAKSKELDEEEELDDAVADEPAARTSKGYGFRGLHKEHGKLRKSQGRYFS